MVSKCFHIVLKTADIGSSLEVTETTNLRITTHYSLSILPRSSDIHLYSVVFNSRLLHLSLSQTVIETLFIPFKLGTA